MNLKIVHSKFTEVIEIKPEIACDLWKEIYFALPFESNAEKWKQEIYFKVPVKIKGGDKSARVEPGDVAYYPPMNVLCVFYGSSQPIAPVNIIGRVKNPEKFSEVRQGDLIRIEGV